MNVNLGILKKNIVRTLLTNLPCIWRFYYLANLICTPNFSSLAQHPFLFKNKYYIYIYIYISFMNRRHTCRKCGKVCCGPCSSKTANIGEGKLERVCNVCYLECEKDKSTSNGKTRAMAPTPPRRPTTTVSSSAPISAPTDSRCLHTFIIIIELL